MLNDLKLELKITLAKDGQEALDIMSDGQDDVPDMVILDLNLPRVDGFDVLRYMRAKDTLRSIPVMVMTGSLRLEDEERSRELGATDYCIKPATAGEMDRTTLCLKKNLELVPTKGKSYHSNTSASLRLAPQPLLFRDTLILHHTMERTMINFQNTDPRDSWK
jgi:DNA-binding response OmpR family regulator